MYLYSHVFTTGFLFINNSQKSLIVSFSYGFTSKWEIKIDRFLIYCSCKFLPADLFGFIEYFWGFRNGVFEDHRRCVSHILQRINNRQTKQKATLSN